MGQCLITEGWLFDVAGQNVQNHLPTQVRPGQHEKMRRSTADSPQRALTFLIPRFRPVDRLLARFMSWRLDAELAAGRPPEWSPLHAARADSLVSLSFRTELADNWDRVLGIATGQEAASGTGRRFLRKEPIAEAAPQIRELTALLRAPEPVSARGVASAHRLLTDGTGPLFNHASEIVLSDAAADAVALLRSASPMS